MSVGSDYVTSEEEDDERPSKRPCIDPLLSPSVGVSSGPSTNDNQTPTSNFSGILSPLIDSMSNEVALDICRESGLSEEAGYTLVEKWRASILYIFSI